MRCDPRHDRLKSIQQPAAVFGKARQRANQFRLTADKSANTKKL
jgi:hypothetical protein